MELELLNLNFVSDWRKNINQRSIKLFLYVLDSGAYKTDTVFNLVLLIWFDCIHYAYFGR